MRFYVADDSGYINEMLSFIFEDMSKYDWIFADMVPHVYKGGVEVMDTIFEQEKFYILGEDLYSFLKEYKVLLIFGVVIAVEKGNEKILENIPEPPIITENREYWKDEYNLTLPGSVMEFGFFDTSILMFASDDNYNIEKFKSSFQNVVFYVEDEL
ncbi:hypothetical protein BWGOE4_16220 [Bacillus mycoides]|uniref:DUF2691 family protein n=1 Tax=Bacillus mycoides TaxID=1405 RepID=A0A1D3MJE2_BACMY|nr:hypothetical protein [Bacillus mycoides]MBJ8069584.1 hypothetical protein [Bacillus cereus]MBJ8187478.1 hypothetical protein [Bacillus cereus]OFD51133.1 hypothetical protein BWGOE3_12160 [Bacillus mycoides]OFD62188.1 hypothetical protein BWGOE6_12500 [Bacillus mycoides]OFD64682.1 hypothetical protein BWGOE4_16220 [Bacillus mycoides]